MIGFRRKIEQSIALIQVNAMKSFDQKKSGLKNLSALGGLKLKL
jgi:hypothetical protein